MENSDSQKSRVALLQNLYSHTAPFPPFWPARYTAPLLCHPVPE